MASFDQLSMLDTTRTNWKIKVRVTRMWPSLSNASEGRDNLKVYNLILLDDDNYHVRAFIYADNWKNVNESIEEGGLYEITNFYTKEAKGSMRPISSSILINFSHSTTVVKLPADDFMIPIHKFECVDLGDLFALARSYPNLDTPDFSTDIIGVLEDFEYVKNIKTMYGQRNIIRFRITDGRNSSKVSVWGDFAVKTDTSYRQIEERPIIAIVTSTKPKIYKNSVQISTLPSSKVYLNLDIDSVTSMRNRLLEKGYTVGDGSAESAMQNYVAPAIETFSLSQLSEIGGTDSIKKQVYCTVQISSVAESHSWNYESCGGCQTKFEKKEGKLYCNECKKNLPVAVIRFRIVILGEDEKEAFNFILMDRASKRLLGTTATKLISNLLKKKTPNAFPNEVKELTGKEVQLLIEISKDNVVSKSKLFVATDAFLPGASSSGMSSTAFTESSMDNSSIADAASIQLGDCRDTLGSVKSSRKKMKTEKTI